MGQWVKDQVAHAQRQRYDFKTSEEKKEYVEMSQIMLDKLQSGCFTSSKLLINLNSNREEWKKRVLTASKGLET